jgi:hypothetical protein
MEEVVLAYAVLKSHDSRDNDRSIHIGHPDGWDFMLHLSFPGPKKTTLRLHFAIKLTKGHTKILHPCRYIVSNTRV